MTTASKITLARVVMIPVFMVLLLLGSLYPGTVKKRLTILHAAAMGIAAALTVVLPTFWLATVCTAAWICAIPYLFCLIWGVTRH